MATEECVVSGFLPARYVVRGSIPRGQLLFRNGDRGLQRIPRIAPEALCQRPQLVVWQQSPSLVGGGICGKRVIRLKTGAARCSAESRSSEGIHTAPNCYGEETFQRKPSTAQKNAAGRRIVGGAGTNAHRSTGCEGHHKIRSHGFKWSSELF